MGPFLTAAPDINVDEIMESVRRRIRERRQGGAVSDPEIRAIESAELLPLSDYLEIPAAYKDHLYPAPGPAAPAAEDAGAPAAAPVEPVAYRDPGSAEFQADHDAAMARIESDLRTFQAELEELRAHPFRPAPTFELAPVIEGGPIKKVLKGVRRLLLPLLRFFARPIVRDLEKTINGLANHIVALGNDLQQFRATSQEERLLVRVNAAFDTQHLHQKLYDQHTAIFDAHRAIFDHQRAVSDLYRRLDEQRPTLNDAVMSKEYVKLLHNVTSNLIAEVSKLKTDLELGKTKDRVLEEKMEFLENRNRALEKRLTPP